MPAIEPPVPQQHFPSPYQRPAQAPDVARRVRRPDGAEIAAFVYRGAGGAGAPVLFLHGNGEEHGIFGPIIDAVRASGRDAIGVDSRAQGRSTRGGGPLDYGVMAADAIAVLDALDVPRAHVLGFSDGAIEGLLLARDHGVRVASLVADGANLTPDGVADDDGGLAAARGALQAWARWWQEGGQGRAAHPDVEADLLTPSPAQAALEAELLEMMEREPHIEASSLATISCPTAVVAGEFDAIAPEETEAIARAIPAATLTIVAGCGHVLPKEAPDELARILFETIGRAEG